MGSSRHPNSKRVLSRAHSAKRPSPPRRKIRSALRREVEDVGTPEREAVESASKSADLTDITAMLLVRLDSIHAALDAAKLVQAKVAAERPRISELTRETFENDERQAS